jgi:hypothetical protein
MVKVRQLYKPPRETPRTQPGGEMLGDITSICLRWTRGDIYSDEAIEQIGDIVARDEYFFGLLECAGWTHEDNHE